MAPQKAPWATTPSGLRPDIQALRTLAVLLVVINHIWPQQLTGGYIGVDIFFVISGFLISAHLYKELQNKGRISLPHFYAKRARRLLPAALLVTITTLIFSLLFLPQDRWKNIAYEAFASTAYFQNWALAGSATNYFTQDTPPTPFQHYWSLSVEEQFYLFWPLALVFLYAFALKLTARTSDPTDAPLRRRLALLISLIAATSLTYSHYLVVTAPSPAYFNTFGRIWEFMLGALAFLLAPALAAQNMPRNLAGTLQALIWGSLLGLAFAYSPQTPFPGIGAFLPAALTAFLLLLGPTTHFAWLHRLLSLTPIQFIGNISYSIYLWHWPLIIILPFILRQELNLTQEFLLLAFSIILGALTKYTVEDPGRSKLFSQKKPRWTLLTALATALLMGLTSHHITQYSNQQQALLEAQRQEQLTQACFGANAILHPETCPDPLHTSALPSSQDTPWDAYPQECIFTREDDAPSGGKIKQGECDFTQGAPTPQTLVLVGDSHAEHYMHTFLPLAASNGWKLILQTHSGCALATATSEAGNKHPSDHANSCQDWAKQTLESLKGSQPNRLILANLTVSQNELHDAPESAQRLLSALEEGLPQAEITVLRDLPYAGEAIGSNCVALTAGQTNTCLAPRDQVLRDDALANASTNRERVRLIDPSRYVCNDQECSGVVGQVPVYYDNHHITRTFARSLAPAMAQDLSQAWTQDIQGP